MEADLETNELVELTAEIVSAYVANNTVVATDLPAVIHNVFEALNKASNSVGQPVKEELKPAVPLKKSVTPEFLICLEDGKKFKSLKRHLRTHYDLSPARLAKCVPISVLRSTAMRIAWSSWTRKAASSTATS